MMNNHLDIADACKVFDSPMLVDLDDRQDYGEDRWIGVGFMDSSRIVVVVFTEPEEDVVRIISMRKATSEESNKYEQEFKKRFK